jgi:hypothetical protein
MSKLVGLDDLVWLANPAADYANRVFQGPLWYLAVHQLMHKLKRILGKFWVTQASRRPVHTTDAKVGAWWVGYHQVKALVYDVKNIALVMRSRLVAWQ